MNLMYNLQRKNLSKHFLVGSAMLVASLGFYSCSDEALDRENDQPTGLNSLYGYVESQGNFTKFVQLIQDLGEKDILAKTGSRTLFVADDAAFDEFFKSNPWGVRSYSELSLAQKKILLYSAMIDNPYPTTLLSSAQPGSSTGGPVPGEVFRRVSSQSILDTVEVIPSNMYAEKLPKNKFFEAIQTLDTIVLFKDATAHPMIHFNGKFLQGNKLSTTDVDFLYGNPDGTFKTEDVYVNNAKVKVAEGKANIFCSNGFIHEVDKVVLPLDNMAEIVRTNPNTKYFNSILDRFTAPQDSTEMTRAYTGNTRAENVFVQRYFSKRSYGSSVSAGSSTDAAFNRDKDGTLFDANENLLKFDPGWNAYVSDVSNPRTAMMEDMAAMLVPNDEAIEQWWNGASGKIIRDYYKKYAKGDDIVSELNAVPTSVIAKLVNVNMLSSFVGALPTNFADILNDANEPMGVAKEYIDNVILGCNGAVYVTNKVFAPRSYSSVLFPAVIDTTQMKVINNAIMTMDYDKYLNSMVAYYRFVIPTNKGMLTYVDPVSYGQTTRNLWEFKYDERTQTINAEVFECEVNADGTVTKLNEKSLTKLTSGTNNEYIFNRMLDLLDNIIVVSDSNVEKAYPNKKYFKTKGNNYIKFEGTNDPDNPTLTKITPTWQAEHGTTLVPHQIFRVQNGTAYVADGLAMGTTKSVCQILNEKEDFSEFLAMLQACGAVSIADAKDNWYAADQQFGNLLHYSEKDGKKSVNYLLNAYHYTIYAPTNNAMQKAYAMGLPSLDDLDAAENLDNEEGGTFHQDSIKAVMLDFIKYHIQDNSIFVDDGFEPGNYESGKTKLHIATADEEEGTEVVENYTPGRPYKINVVSCSSDGITIKDEMQNEIKISKREGYYNLMAREWWLIDEKNKKEIKTPYSCKIDNSSSAVIHAVDTPLLYNYKAGSTNPDENQFLYKDRKLSTESGIKNMSPKRKQY